MMEPANAFGTTINTKNVEIDTRVDRKLCIPSCSLLVTNLFLSD